MAHVELLTVGLRSLTTQSKAETTLQNALEQNHALLLLALHPQNPCPDLALQVSERCRFQATQLHSSSTHGRVGVLPDALTDLPWL